MPSGGAGGGLAPTPGGIRLPHKQLPWALLLRKALFLRSRSRYTHSCTVVISDHRRWGRFSLSRAQALILVLSRAEGSQRYCSVSEAAADLVGGDGAGRLHGGMLSGGRSLCRGCSRVLGSGGCGPLCCDQGGGPRDCLLLQRGGPLLELWGGES